MNQNFGSGLDESIRTTWISSYGDGPLSLYVTPLDQSSQFKYLPTRLSFDRESITCSFFSLLLSVGTRLQLLVKFVTDPVFLVPYVLQYSAILKVGCKSHTIGYKRREKRTKKGYGKLMEYTPENVEWPSHSEGESRSNHLGRSACHHHGYWYGGP